MKKLKYFVILFLILLFPKSVIAETDGWVQDNGFKYYYKSGEMLKGIYEIDGRYYHFGQNTGQLKIGWSITLDKKEYYSDKNGVMQFGWVQDGYGKYYITKEEGSYKGIYEINGKYYHFGQNTKQLKTGWSITLDKKEYYSDQNGVMKFGWIQDGNYKYYITKEEGSYKGIYEIDGKYYHFGQNTKQLKTGWSITLDKREYYSDQNGVMQFGWIQDGNYKYYITKEEGSYKGIYEIDGKYYHFGQNTKQLKTGWSITLDKREYYSDQNGVMQFGWIQDGNNRYYVTKDDGLYKGVYEIDGNCYFFDQNTGKLKKGWNVTTDNKEYYSDQNGVMQFGWIQDGNNRYYVTKDDGAYRGIYEIDGKYYHFGQNSKQLKIGWSITLDKKEYYSDQNGVMQFGWIQDGNNKYYITMETGAYKGIYEIDGNYYHFGQNSKQLKIGWSITLDKNEYYSDKDGILQKGNQYIDNNWYTFGDDYSLQKGWQVINGKTYYFYSDGTKARYIQKIAGTRYEFSSEGELQHSNIKVIADLSKHNGVIDWDKLWSSGEVDGVILRAGYSITIDSRFVSYLNDVKRLSIPYSVYHFTTAENRQEALNEANRMVSWYRDNSLNTSMGVFYDIESWVNYEDGHTSDGITKDDYDTIISTYKGVLNDNGIYMSVYTGKNYAETRLSDYGRSQIDWIAHYASDCGYNGKYRGWQYTSKGKLSGVSGNVDFSIFYY